MALERIDPFIKEDRFSLDHLTRYEWATRLTAGKRVLDVACGEGFGSLLLRRLGAAEVLGVDRDSETVKRCCEQWPCDGLRFAAGTIEKVREVAGDGWGAVVCFETLEHLVDPALALEEVAAALGEGGILIGSVPGETEWGEENPYHFHHFDRKRLEQLLRGQFEHFAIYEQCYQVASVIQQGEVGSMLQTGEETCFQPNFGSGRGGVDSYLFIASGSSLPGKTGNLVGYSRAAWEALWNDYWEAMTSLKNLQEAHQRLFLEESDLRCRFNRLLAWGRYQFHLAHGIEVECHYLDREAFIGEEEEAQRREWVEELQAENARMRVELAEKTRELEEFSNKKRTLFAEALQSGDAKGARGRDE